MSTSFEEKSGKSHHLSLENRKMLILNGITDVLAFDENSALLKTDVGILSVEGEMLHILEMSVDSGDLTLEGKINHLWYADKSSRKTGLFGKK